jgi:sugar lactone lactonase YvrE
VSEGRVVLGGAGFLEAPRWYEDELWFSDFFSRRVSSVDLDGQVTERGYVAGQPSGIGFGPDGTILVVSSHDGHVVRLGGNATSVVSDVGAIYRGGLNDMVVDSSGCAYISTFPVPVVGGASLERVAQSLAPIVFVDQAGTASVVAEDLRIGNGMVITPDGNTLIVAETLGKQLLAFDIASDGTLSDRRTFAGLGERKPDGICLDVDGNVWVGSFSTSEFVLVAEGGEVLRVIATPGRWAVACALGGPDGTTLYGLTARVEIAGFLQGRGEGAIEAFEVEIPGA